MSHKGNDSRPQHVHKWWVALLLFPWLQVGPIMPGTEGDDQLDRLKKIQDNPTELPMPDFEMPAIPAMPRDMQLPRQITGRRSISDIPRRIVERMHWTPKK